MFIEYALSIIIPSILLSLTDHKQTYKCWCGFHTVPTSLSLRAITCTGSRILRPKLSTVPDLRRPSSSVVSVNAPKVIAESQRSCGVLTCCERDTVYIHILVTLRRGYLCTDTVLVTEVYLPLLYKLSGCCVPCDMAKL